MAIFSLLTARSENDIPDSGIDLLRRVAHSLAKGGHILRSRGISRAEQEAVTAALAAGGATEIWLPTGVEVPEWAEELRGRFSRNMRIVTLSSQRNSMLVAAARSGFGHGRTVSPATARELACVFGLVSQAETALFFSSGTAHRGRTDRGDLEPALALAESYGIPVLDLCGIAGLAGLDELLGKYGLRLPPEGSLRPLPPPPPPRRETPLSRLAQLKEQLSRSLRRD